MGDHISFLPQNFGVNPMEIWNDEDADDSIDQLVCFNEPRPASPTLHYRDEIFVQGKTMNFVSQLTLIDL
jgi:hypothetical protein